MPIEIRPLRGDEHEALALAEAAAWATRYEPQATTDIAELLEPDRVLVALDGGRVVGAAAGLTMRLGVPGNTVDIAGVTLVFVLPTHRRRGILRDLMRRQLDDLHRRGDTLAALGASESLLYRRFGYGIASQHADIEVDTRHAAFRGPVDDGGSLEMAGVDALLAQGPAVYERVQRTTVGMTDRRPSWWRRVGRDLSEGPREAPAQVMLHRDAEGRADGYAAYRVTPRWTNGLPGHLTRVEELVAERGAPQASLWRALLSLDLSSELRAWRRPVEEPLLHLLDDPRRLRRVLVDDLHLRILDVAAALGARRYAREDALTIEVRDEVCPWNAGVYHLEGGLDGATCRRQDGAGADLVMDVATLAAAHLGQTSLMTMAAAGAVEERRPGATRRAAAMLAWPEAAWNVHEF